MRSKALSILISLVLAASLCPASALGLTGSAFTSSAEPIYGPKTWGEITWEIDGEGCLVIAPANGTSGVLRGNSQSGQMDNGGEYDKWDSTSGRYWVWLDAPDTSLPKKIKSVRFEPGVAIDGSATRMFAGCSNLVDVDFTNFDASKMTSMRCMFLNCSSLESVDFSGLDTSNVVNMSSMFVGSGVSDVNMEGVDTHNVKYMSDMFNGCSAKELDLSSFDTSNVVDMSGMFKYCSSLETLEFPATFTTSNVTNMGSMFFNCEALSSLDVSGFDTSKVNDMSWMFSGCTSLAGLDVSRFDTSNVTDMTSMFYGDSSLESLNAAGLDASAATSLCNMFYECGALKKLNLAGFVTAAATDMSGMFSGCAALQSLDLKGFRTSNVTNMRNMFNHCDAIKALDLSSFDTSNVTDMDGLVSVCESLEALNMAHFDTSATNSAFIIDYCPNLKQITIGEKTKLPESTGLSSEDTWAQKGGPYLYTAEKLIANSGKKETAGVWVLGGKASLNGASVKPSISSVVFDGTAKKPGVTVQLLGSTLGLGGEFTVKSYSDNVKPGTATITVVGTGRYEGTATGSFAITRAELSKASVVLSQKSFAYDGKAKKPGVTVKLAGKALVADVDYSVAYQNNVNAGTATVIVTGKGNYTGCVKAAFEIVKKPTPAKARNPMKVAGKTVKIKAATLKKRGKTYSRSKAFKLSGAQGKVSFAKKSGNKKISVTKAGSLKIRKGLKKNTYRVIVKVSASGNSRYKALSSSAVVKVKVI